MSAPPWVFACIVSLINAWHSDKTQEKVCLISITCTQFLLSNFFSLKQFYHIVGPIVGGLVGFVICMATLNTAARYVALFLQASSYAGFIVFYSWISSSFPRPPAKRAVALAMVNAFSQLGNVAGMYVWDLKQDGYRRSYGIVTAMFGLTIIGCWLFKSMLIGLNRKLESGELQVGWEAQETQNGKVDSTTEQGVNPARLEMSRFRYLV